MTIRQLAEQQPYSRQRVSCLRGSHVRLQGSDVRLQ